MSVTLLEMDKDKAVVAEQVNTYKRTEVEAGIPLLQKQIEKDGALISRIAEQAAQTKARYDSNLYKLELFVALKEAFDHNFPVSGSTTPTEGEQPGSTLEHDVSDGSVGSRKSNKVKRE